MTTGIFRFVLSRRAIGRLAKHQWLLDPAVSNVPGPPVPLYLAGAQLLEIFLVVPLVGNQTLNVGVLSYTGQPNLTAVAEGDACPEIDAFAQGVRNTVEKLALAVGSPYRRREWPAGIRETRRSRRLTHGEVTEVRQIERPAD
jgi:hypothetical protein